MLQKIFLIIEKNFKNQARFNIEEAQEVLFWIEQVTEQPFDRHPATMQTAQDVADALKDGIHLCRFVLYLISSLISIKLNET